MIDIPNPPTSHKLKGQPQINRIKDHLSVIHKVMPVISKASIKNVSAGIPTYTQDLRFIADKVGDGSNLFVITACQETGITHGPALGNMMDDFISTNTPSPELKSF